MKCWYIDKFLFDIGMASSRTEAARLVRAGAVEIDGTRVPPEIRYLVMYEPDDENL